ncbi:MAG: phosphoglycerate kinase [Candidatus Portnoybacteria bacterium]|nr:phosphoglycerate kinase [Candidatus Portnoybacteria bacterium]MDD4982559.1 phosphoglycerate kinase [Candidatus Portnoybacteria bacterium]
MKLLKNMDVAKKRVLVRVDFNVSLGDSGQVLDDFRLRATLPTIQYLKQQGSKIILMAHLGRPDGRVKPEFGLSQVKAHLEKLLGEAVGLASDCVGKEVEIMAQDLKEGEILLLENLRFHPEEEKNDADFAKRLAGLGEIYINDAFGVSHRAHASVAAITEFLPACAGFLLAKEIENLSRVRDRAEHPLCIIIGGAKISTKLKLIQSFLGKAEDIILGGALANTVLRAKGMAIGQSMVEEIEVEKLEKLEITNSKIHLPPDAILCHDKNNAALCRVGPVGDVKSDEMILDIGPDSEKLFSNIIGQAKMVIWNGPMGLFEKEAFAGGTLAVARAIADSGAFSIIGGGETVTLLEEKKMVDKFSFVSTGGGAMMEFLCGDKLPGIIALEK